MRSDQPFGEAVLPRRTRGNGFVTKAGTMPTHEGLRPIVVCELDATSHLPPQHGQLMPESGILRLKSALRLERRGEQRQEEA